MNISRAKIFLILLVAFTFAWLFLPATARATCSGASDGPNIVEWKCVKGCKWLKPFDGLVASGEWSTSETTKSQALACSVFDKMFSQIDFSNKYISLHFPEATWEEKSNSYVHYGKGDPVPHTVVRVSLDGTWQAGFYHNEGWGHGWYIARGTWDFTRPEVPSNLEAKALSCSSVRLTWQDNSSSESGFIIERATNEFFATLDAFEVAANVTSFVDDNLNGSTKYYYRVKAKDNKDSLYSNITTVLTPACADSCNLSLADGSLSLINLFYPGQTEIINIKPGSNKGKVRWTSDNDSVAALDKSEGLAVSVQSMGQGHAKIIAQDTAFNTCKLVVDVFVSFVAWWKELPP